VQNVDIGRFISTIPPEEKENIRKTAVANVKINLILDKIVDLEKIELTEDEFAEQIKFYAEQLKTDENKARDFIARNGIDYRMKIQKAVDLLVESAKISD
jgi:trigger factor